MAFFLIFVVVVRLTDLDPSILTCSLLIKHEKLPGKVGSKKYFW